MRVLSWLARVDELFDGKCAAFEACVTADSLVTVNAAVLCTLARKRKLEIRITAVYRLETSAASPQRYNDNSGFLLILLHLSLIQNCSRGSRIRCRANHYTI